VNLTDFFLVLLVLAIIRPRNSDSNANDNGETEIEQTVDDKLGVSMATLSKYLNVYFTGWG